MASLGQVISSRVRLLTPPRKPTAPLQMSIRRKSTTHDLATLRLHPDGSRVQQSSVNARLRRAAYTVVDSRGNWIAKDAGGKNSVKRRRSKPTDDMEGELIDLSGDEEYDKDARRRSKGKERADQAPEEPPQEQVPEPLDARTRQRLSFPHDLSFLDPPPVSASLLGQNTAGPDASSANEPVVSFLDPSSDLLKSIHHFASCYYRERGQLFDSGRNYRGMKKARNKRSQENIHTLARNTVESRDTDPETEHTDTEDEIIGTNGDDNEREGPKAKTDRCRKDMYKAFDGSALMAIGMVLQEYVAHTLALKPPTTPDEPHIPKRRRTR